MPTAHSHRRLSIPGHVSIGNAFTLVELLVVLATGTLLVSQIVPAADKARDDARRTVCQQRLGEIARAAHAYAAADPFENGIPLAPADARSSNIQFSYYAFGGKSGRGNDTHPSLRYSQWAGANLLNAFHRPLNHMLYKEPVVNPPHPTWAADARLKLDVYSCPGDQGFPGMHHTGWANTTLSSYNYYGTSYAANALFFLDVGYYRALTNSMYARPLSHTPNPANTVFYWENAARFAPWAPNTDDYDQSGCFWGTGLYAQAANQNMVAHGNHGQDWHFNIAFADGHVDFLPVRGYGRVYGLNDELLANGFCQPFGSETSCDCILVRGLGWQLDTLPAEPHYTDKRPDVVEGGPLSGSSSSYYVVVP